MENQVRVIAILMAVESFILLLLRIFALMKESKTGKGIIVKKQSIIWRQ